MNVYFISGLGADERAFQRLTLPAIYKIHHIKWPALSVNESLSSYCSKIAGLIDISQEFAIIGLSFGGMIATELAKILDPKVTILISSVSTKYELPFIFRACGFLKVNKLVPASAMNKPYFFHDWFWGLSKGDNKKLIKEMLRETDPKFLKWAINEILNWRNTIRPGNLFHIHGTADRIFPFRSIKADRAVQNGSHLMVYINSGIVSRLLEEGLSRA